MSVIACLGWGSLYWDPKELRIDGSWNFDGPMVRVEFLRKSAKRKCITLVLDDASPPVQSLWAKMNTADLKEAIKSLQDREEVPDDYVDRNIGRWSTGDAAPANIEDLPAWAAAHDVDAVIWTALGHKFHKNKTRPSVEDIVGYLECLTGAERDTAEEYVRLAPPQIETPYRQVIGQKLGWTPKD